VSKEEWSRELVVEVDGGLEQATLDAEKAGLELLGEVLPDSGLWHMRQPRRCKRSPGEVQSSISSLPTVLQVQPQKVLSRVKRQGWRDERELAVREQCFVSTIGTKESPSRRCVFPFEYKGTVYQRCTSDHSANEEQWCATSVARDGSVIIGEWGDCDFANIECRTLPPLPQPRPQGPPEAPRPSSNLQDAGSEGGLPVRPHQDSDKTLEVMLEATRRPVPPPPQPKLPPPQPPRLPMGTHRLPATLDEFLLLLGPRGPPRPRPTMVKEMSAELKEEKRDASSSSSGKRWTDAEWPKQWYLNRGNALDMNVEAAWDRGYSGKGVTVTILDDGVEWNHPDLSRNYREVASYDINGNDADPFPRYDLFDTNKHGTRCAGQVAAEGNNSVCSVGVAFNSGIGGVRMLDGTITDAVEARSLSLNPQDVHIYSASWGPDDDGRTVDGPGPLTRRALEEGASKGRGGKGSIFVWASGNGGKFQDNCNCDGYATSIFTLSVSSASENGGIPWYSEQCSSTLATTYSSGSSRAGERKVITTDLHGRCTSSHTGTSASSPMAAGIIALVLEANPLLTWRDVQHIVVRSAKKANLVADDWKTNAAGFNVSHAFGFGLMDAGKMVERAEKWEKVPQQQKCSNEYNGGEEAVRAGWQTRLNITVDDCDSVQVLEHVHVVVDISSRNKRGEFEIRLTSPSGTESKLLALRPLDNSISGFSNFRTWPLMSTHYWGEQTKGRWSLEVKNSGGRTAYVRGWRIVLYGTTENHNEETS